MMIIDSPIMYILKNEDTSRFHPIALKKVPMMGIQLESDPDRWKSIGHHTKGLDTLQEAKDSVLESCKDLHASDTVIGDVRYDIETIIQWDGLDMPIVNAILNVNDFTLYTTKEN